MKLPRDISGDTLSRALIRYGYQVSRQTGSHFRLTSSIKNTEHHITIPLQKSLKVGTLNGILNDIAAYLEIDKKNLIKALFGE